MNSGPSVIAQPALRTGVDAETCDRDGVPQTQKAASHFSCGDDAEPRSPRDISMPIPMAVAAERTSSRSSWATLAQGHFPSAGAAAPGSGEARRPTPRRAAQRTDRTSLRAVVRRSAGVDARGPPLRLRCGPATPRRRPARRASPSIPMVSMPRMFRSDASRSAIWRSAAGIS